MFETDLQWKKKFIDCCALREGRIDAPYHVALPNGHCGLYLNADVISGNAKMMVEACKDLIDRLKTYIVLSNIDAIIGLDPESNVLAYEALRQICNELGERAHCQSSYISRDKHGNGELRGIAPREHSRVVLVGTSITSESELRATILDLTRRKLKVNGPILALLNMLTHKRVENYLIVALMNEPAIIYPGACPMCGAGSKALVPGEPDFWKRLESAI